MCKYCNYDFPLHYLLNNAPLLTNNVASTISEPESIFPQADIDPVIDPNAPTETSEPAINELTTIEASVTENQTSTFQVPDTAFGKELKGDRHYTATLASGELLPDWIEIDVDAGELTFQAEYEEVGNHQILVQVEDNFGQTASTIVEVGVINEAGEANLLVDEPDAETFIAVSESDLGTSQDTVAIPQVAIADTQITDSSVGRELIFTITLSSPSEQTVTVDYSTADDTAIAGEDYVAIAGTVTFAPGETEQTITVNTTGTSFLDPDEDLLLNLTNPRHGEIVDEQARGTILPAYAGIRGGARKQETVTFSFFDEDIFGQGGYDGSDRESNAKEPSEVIKNNYRQIFADLNTFVEREFVEVEETAAEQGNIRIVVSDGPDYAYAGGHIHLAGWATASDAGINGWESPQGAYAYSALLHELGHAVGMPHSFGRETSVFDPEESAVNTVMSYTSPGSKAATFMSYDIKSLQERYGAAEYRPEDTVYEFVTVDNYLVDGEIAIDTNRRLRQTIWDSGGIDTFDFSGLAAEDGGYRFDLNQSQYQTTQAGFTGASYDRNGTTYYVPSYGTSIAIDVEIENLINSSSDDLIITNDVANTFSGYAPGLTTGDDVFIGTNELDTLDLSEFSFLDIAETVQEVDLKVDLGEGNSITVKDYLNTPQDKRMKVLLDGRRINFKEDGGVIEGDGNNLINFTVELSQASSDRLEIDYTTADGTAKADLDYIPQAGTLVFEPGETSKAIAVEVIDDQEIEGTEALAVNLLGNYGQTIEQGIGFISDNDGSQSLSTITISDAVVTNGNNASKAVFTVRVDELLDFEPVTVDFSTLDNVAIAGQDYEANSGTLVFSHQDRVKEQTIEVDIIDNNLSRDEDFKLQLSNPSSNATIADDEGVGTIVDSTLKVTFADGTATDFQLASYPPDSEKDPDNLPFEVSSDHNSLTITGDGDGWKEIPLTDNLDSRNSPLNPYTVVEFDFKTTEAGKLHGLHFESRDHHDYYAPWEKGRFFQLYGSSEFGIQDFNDYQDSLGEWKTYQIPVGQFIDNTVFHDGKYKAVQWLAFAHEGNSEDSNSQFRNLKFQELLPVSVAGVTANEGDGTATFTLTIPEASDSAITLDYATADGTAIAGQDYIAAQGNVTFAPGETSQTIEITVNDDGESEGEESFSLSLSNVNQAISLESAIIAVIADNDEPLPVISVENISFAEGNSETSTASVTVNLDKSANRAIAVNYITENNTAIADQDYQAVEGTVTFAPGETSQTLSLTLKGDVLNETDESFWLNLA
ncbi:MAG: Calx-beta domain-containing protein, partial [Cyanobacteria bacterium J06648_1]